jgi:hypothetical protein
MTLCHESNVVNVTRFFLLTRVSFSMSFQVTGFPNEQFLAIIIQPTQTNGAAKVDHLLSPQMVIQSFYIALKVTTLLRISRHSPTVGTGYQQVPMRTRLVQHPVLFQRVYHPILLLLYRTRITAGM